VGKLPTFLGDLPLIDLTIGQNRFSGPIPTVFGKLTNLRRLWLSDNLLTGNIPSELYLLSDSLRFLYLDSNRLVGSLSAKVANWAQIGKCIILHLQFFSHYKANQLHSTPF